MSRVRDVLQTKGSEVLTVAPATPVMRVAQRMRTEHIGAYVVSSRVGQLDGLVTERDIVFAIARHGAGALDLPVSAVMSKAPSTCAPDDTVRAGDDHDDPGARARTCPSSSTGCCAGSSASATS